MILVTLGTQDKDFKRLLKAIDKQIKNKNISEKVIVQAGSTKYKSKNMEIFDLIPEEKLEALVKECRILITHGGVGSILMGIKNNKPVIAAARLEKFGEHTNDHQKQIIQEFVERGYILELDNFDKLDEKLNEASKFKPKKFVSNTNKFTKNIEKYIEEDNHTSWFNKYRDLVSNGYRGIIYSIINIILFINLMSKYSLFTNILISYFITILISLILNFFIDIKYKKMTYFITSIISLILDLSLMYILTNILNIGIINSKIITTILIIIGSYISCKYFNKKNNIYK